LKGYEPYIDETIEKLIVVLDKHDAENAPINMTRWCQFWAFDVMSKLSFGESLGFLEHGYDFNGMIQAQRENFRYISVANNFPLLDSLTKRNVRSSMSRACSHGPSHCSTYTLSSCITLTLLF
jgi:hypothetical protein